MEKLRSRNSHKENHLKSKPVPSPSVSIDFVKAYLKSLIADGRDVLAGHYSATDATFDCQTVEHRLTAEGLGFATSTLPCLIGGLLDLLEGREASFPQFRKKRGTEYPVFLHRLFHLAVSGDTTYVRSAAFDILYSISVAFKKLRGTYKKSTLVKQFANFVEVDSLLDKLDLFNGVTGDILCRAKDYITSLFRSFDVNTIRSPRPGPGATNVSTKKCERYRPRVLYKQIDKVLDYQDWWYPTPWDACLRSRDFLQLHKYSVEEPCARFKFVPKTYGKARGICIEENEMQVMQQSVRVALYDFIEMKFGQQIALRDQSINARLALASSSDLKMSTIDMSEASDRISRELVAWLFQHTPIYELLMALSTRWILPPKDLAKVFPYCLRTKKYAPMGSALCFPIMSLVHMALLQGILGYDDYTHGSTEIFVYGDDIVLPSADVGLVFDYLPNFGMKLNLTKSFVKSNFRESCGIHAYYGIDVTPLYVKYQPNHNSFDTIVSAIAVESQAFNKGLKNTANVLREWTRTSTNFALDDVPAGLSLAGFQRTFDETALRRFKLHSRKRWNHDYQCYEYKVKRFHSYVEQYDMTSDDAYLRWLWTGTVNPGEVGNVFQPAVGDSPSDLTLRTEWVLESALNAIPSVLKDVNLRPCGRCTAGVHPQLVVLRQSFNLQEADAHTMCVFV